MNHHRKTVPGIIKHAIKETLSHKRKAPHISELAQHFMDLVGGARALAKLLHTEYLAAPQGGLIRQRILEIVFRATKVQNEREGVTDISNLSDEDLERELEQLLPVTNGCPSSETDH